MNTTCPPEVSAAIERMCAAVRQNELAPYSELLRTNALDVVTGCFPRFAQRVGMRSMEQHIDAFIREAHATLAQFHQIATEFLRYSERLPLDPIARCLLEYEWTLFAVEIAPETVAPPALSTAPPAQATFDHIALNPTARLVALPFDLHVPEGEAEEMVRNGVPPFVYAVYRTADHRVMTQHLASDDILFLTELEKAAGTDVCAPPRGNLTTARSTWQARALQLELIVLRRFASKE